MIGERKGILLFLIPLWIALVGCQPEETKFPGIPMGYIQTGSPSGVVKERVTSEEQNSGWSTISVELRGLDELTFADGSWIEINEFIVNLGELSLYPSREDRNGRVDLLSERDASTFQGEFEGFRDRILIKADLLQNSDFEEAVIQLIPAAEGNATENYEGTSIYLKGTYYIPANNSPQNPRAISPDPAPARPQAYLSTRSLSNGNPSVTVLPFIFRSFAVENIQVSLEEGEDGGIRLVLVFHVNHWFTEQTLAIMKDQARDRARGNTTPLEIRANGGGDPGTQELGGLLQQNILDNVSIELKQ